MQHLPCWYVIGVIDSNDALHHHKVLDGESLPHHSDLWPHVHHKRWRFKVRDWDIDSSVLAENSLNEEDYARIDALMRKILVVPEWVRRGDAWEAAGRPHGRAGAKFDRDWEKAEKNRQIVAAAKAVL